jgi:hypothetical protein
MIPKKFIPLNLILLFTIASCGKKSTPNPSIIKKEPVVYITGVCKLANSSPVAVYWRNGFKIALTDSTVSGTSVATGIAVIDTDVYISGTVNGFATYWKNGKAVTLSQGNFSYANAITVSGNDVYIAGRENTQPTYWKNGVPVTLDATGDASTADAIAVLGSDVYVAGNFIISNQIGYWKNGVITKVASSPSDYATYYANTHYQGWLNIAVSGSDVYLTGATPGFLTATYWKNSTPIYELNHPVEQSFLNNITISGTDVYTVGNYYISAVYWKNGIMTSLQSSAPYFSMATAIVVKGSDIYIAGQGGVGGVSQSTKALYWKNDILTTLPGNISATTGIAVVTY